MIKKLRLGNENGGLGKKTLLENGRNYTVIVGTY